MADFIDTDVTVVLDETDGLQNAEVTPVSGDIDDNDILASLVPAEIFPGGALEYALSGYTGAEGDTGAEIFTVSGSGVITGLKLTATAEGGEFQVYEGPFTPDDTYYDSGLKLLDDGDDSTDESIYLFLSPETDNLLLGYTPDGTLALAAYMETVEDDLGNITGGKLWTALYEPLFHPNPGNDDEVDFDLTDLIYVASTEVQTFNLEGAPSGQNLHITATSGDGVAIIVTGMNPADTSEGQDLNEWDTLNTSKGGGPTTFGTNNQMLNSDPTGGDGLVISFVTDTNPDYTVAETDPRLDQNEADLESTIQFMVVMANLDIDGAAGTATALDGGTTYEITNLSIEFSDFSFLAQDGDTLGALIEVVLSRLRSGPSTHLCDLSLKSQGAFAT